MGEAIGLGRWARWVSGLVTRTASRQESPPGLSEEPQFDQEPQVAPQGQGTSARTGALDRPGAPVRGLASAGLRRPPADPARRPSWDIKLSAPSKSGKAWPGWGGVVG